MESRAAGNDEAFAAPVATPAAHTTPPAKTRRRGNHTLLMALACGPCVWSRAKQLPFTALSRCIARLAVNRLREANRDQDDVLIKRGGSRPPTSRVFRGPLRSLAAFPCQFSSRLLSRRTDAIIVERAF